MNMKLKSLRTSATSVSYTHLDVYKRQGRGRIYFRMGVTGKNTGTTPRYAKVQIQWYGGRYGTGDDELWSNTEYMYIRQGEADDYSMRPGTVDARSKDVYKRQCLEE